VVETSLATGTPTETPAIKITIVYDNTAYDERLTPEWGFSAWIEIGPHVILFDTGANGTTLLGNMALLGLDPQRIEAIVLSHEHEDHTGGLLDLLDQGIAPPVYGLATFPAAWLAEVQARTTYIEVSDPVEIVPGVFSTGEIAGRPAEQALVLEGTDGSVVITGCAHPGITNIVAQAQEIVPGKVSLLVGGFHLLQDTEAYVRKTIGTLQMLGVQRVIPTHCTGEEAIALFAEIYGPDGYVQGGAGKVLEIGP
jgi:7,8-dihydropterin-6-yl-methyl-4-(beta-D-ribofuranosyl)aminobenzene 5'-phosphate synthase